MTEMTPILDLAVLALISLWTQVRSDECRKMSILTRSEINWGHDGNCLNNEERGCYYESEDGVARPTLKVGQFVKEMLRVYDIAQITIVIS